MDSKYIALWIRTGAETTIGSICCDTLGNVFRLMHYNDELVFMGDGFHYRHPDSRFQPGKLYLCDKNLEVGKTCFNPATQECFKIPNESYITGLNENADDYNVIGEIDPALLLRGFTPLEEENIEGFHWGAGDDQLGYFVLRAIPEEYALNIPSGENNSHVAFAPSPQEKKVKVDRQRLVYIRNQALSVFELTKGFTPEQMAGASSEFKTMEEMAGYVLELTNNI